MPISKYRAGSTVDPTIIRDCNDDARLASVLALIENGAMHEHSGTSLWAHLLGTFEILNAWGVDKDICLAGLIHSIYSTQYFNKAIVSVDRRKRVAEVAGSRTERLAYLFCNIERVSIREARIPAECGGIARLRNFRTSDVIRVATTTLRALRLIDLANETEQRQRYRAQTPGWFSDVCMGFRTIGFAPRHLSKKMLAIDHEQEDSLLNEYQKSIALTGKRSERLLLRCVERWPQCAEAQLLLAVAQLSKRDYKLAYLNARRGLHDARSWNAAWDTRVPLQAWIMMGMQLQEAAKAGSCEPLPLVLQIQERIRSVT